jgi:hypothetical protein
VSVVLDEFLRRYATSPMHVPRLERLLAVYGGTAPEAFAAAFIAWDRACGHADAARIASELLSLHVDAGAALIRVSDAVIQDAIASVTGGEAAEVRELLQRRLFEAPAAMPGQGHGRGN